MCNIYRILCSFSGYKQVRSGGIERYTIGKPPYIVIRVGANGPIGYEYEILHGVYNW